MKTKNVFVVAALLAAGSAFAQTTSEGSGVADSRSVVDSHDQSQSSQRTLLLPAPVQGTVASGAKCFNHGTKTFGILFNLFSWSTPDHQEVAQCVTHEDVLMLIKTCRYLTAHTVQAQYIKNQYGIDMVPPAGLKDTDCSQPVPAPTPAPKPVEPVPTPAPAPTPSPKPVEPTPAPVPAAEPLAVQVYFDVNKATLRPDAEMTLKAWMGAYTLSSTKRVVINGGHADSDGGDALNYRLSENRAFAVKEWMVTHGVPSEKIRVEFFGKRVPAVPNSSKANKQLNRRVEVTLE